MEGVTILAVNEAVEASVFNWVAAIGFLFLGIIIGFIQGITGDAPGLGLLLGVIIGLIFGALMGLATAEPASPETYKVTISDTVNFNEFNERYEIIDQEGLIYTITERTNENN